ncbi:hypothetical protein T11_16794 [Trichinella zimbabwensis]|uniref:Uncharacterized protein n=1 Tax=Trichinella zimbabwensis TaxID=268475 RepID=A0A0V1HJM4_9BILA|nr:hypothetical protein T11_16794 [Trichinella zimbabwensis]
MPMASAYQRHNLTTTASAQLRNICGVLSTMFAVEERLSLHNFQRGWMEMIRQHTDAFVKRHPSFGWIRLRYDKIRQQLKMLIAHDGEENAVYFPEPHSPSGTA